MKVTAVIGKNFGDEGKGLAVDYFASVMSNTLVIRHNGGAQSGHTVELRESDKRFVFHELSSGSFRYADTLWAQTFFPDLYKLKEEIDDFEALAGFAPNIYAEEEACITIVDDIIINMLLETLRGNNRHGSCGMGLWEATLRSQRGCGITVGEVSNMSLEELVSRLQENRKTYTEGRLKELGINVPLIRSKDKIEEPSEVITEDNKDSICEYIELLYSDEVIYNYAETVINNVSLINVIKETDIRNFVNSYDNIIFEGGQGLLLDSENDEYAPNVSASRTGITNPKLLSDKYGIEIDEVVYVTRAYLTRHGAGLLPNECNRIELGDVEEDKTNLTNDWQGTIRYARHSSAEALLKVPDEGASLMITHLNETNGRIATLGGLIEISPDDFKGQKLYLSTTKYSEDIVVSK